MSHCRHLGLLDVRYVGDPVDVVTGANVEVNFEFQLRGPLPFIFRRHYDSSKSGQHYPLGWGHTHEYDRHLQYDVDGLRYTGPIGRTAFFPPLSRDGDRCAASGLILNRITAHLYRLVDADASSMEFEFSDLEAPASLKAVHRGTASIRFGHSVSGHLHQIVDSEGRIVLVESDESGRILKLVLTNANRGSDRTLMAFSYDTSGNLASGIDGYGHSFSFSYDEQNRLISRTDRRGYSFLYDYDDRGRCVHSRGEDGLHEVWLRYLPLERTTIVTKADKGEWTYLYDDSGVVTTIIDPYGGVRSFKTDASGRIAEEVDPNGDVTKWVYGRNGQLLGKRSTLGELSTDPRGPLRPDQRAHRIPSRPSEWEYGDLLGSRRLRPADASAEAPPDSLRRLVAELFPRGSGNNGESPRDSASEPLHGTRLVYDEVGTLVREIGPDGSARTWGYDAGGNTVRYRDFDNSVADCEYLSWDLPARRTDALGRTLTRRFTTSAQVAELVDAGGVKSSYVHDLKGRVTELWYDGVLFEQYRYDDADNLTAKLDRAGEHVVTHEIGSKNLKTIRRLASGEVHRFSYTARGYYSVLSTDDFSVKFDYDTFLNRTLDERDGRGVEHQFSGPAQLMQTTVLKRFTTRYRWLSDTHMEIRDSGDRAHQVRFLSDGVVGRTMSNGLSEVTQYDEKGRCLTKASLAVRVSMAGTGSPWVQRFSYSGEGDLLESRDSLGKTARYEYDAAHRLRLEIGEDGVPATFRHDAGDNLLEQPGLAGVSIASGNRLRSANGEEFEYDDRGNLAVRRGSRGVTRYHYDSRNMLISCGTDRGEWRATYDPLGRRIRKSFGNEWREFYWDTDRLAAELGHDGRLRVYVYADAFAIVPLLWLDYESPEANPSTARRCFILCNHLGTPVRVENEDGDVVWSAKAAPYGSVVRSDGALIEMPLRFPGHYYDSETGLHYNRFRYYNPELGRYLQPDPMGTEAGSNLYAYASNPFKAVDVRGDCPTNGAGPPDDPPKPKTNEEGEPVEGEPATAEKPRVVPLDEAIATVAKALDDAGVGLGRVKAFGVSTHEDGTVTVACSGNKESVESAQARVELPPNYKIAPSEVDTTGFDPPPPRADGKRQSDSSTCVEPRQAEGERQSGSPVVERTDNPVWRGDPADNPHPRTDASGATDGSTMDQCDSCAINKDRM